MLIAGTNLSIQVTLDPLKPQVLPECAFLGPDDGKAQVTSYSSTISIATAMNVNNDNECVCGII